MNQIEYTYVAGTWKHVTTTPNGLIALFTSDYELHYFNTTSRTYVLVPNIPYAYGTFTKGNRFYGTTYGEVRVADSSNLSAIAVNYLDSIELDYNNLRFNELIKNESYLLVGSDKGLHILEIRSTFPLLREKAFYPTGK